MVERVQFGPGGWPHLVVDVEVARSLPQKLTVGLTACGLDPAQDYRTDDTPCFKCIMAEGALTRTKKEKKEDG